MNSVLKLEEMKVGGAKLYSIDSSAALTDTDAKMLVEWHKESNTATTKEELGIQENNSVLTNFEGLALATLSGFLFGNVNEVYVKTLFSYALVYVGDNENVKQQYKEAMKSVKEQKASPNKINKNAYVKFSKTVAYVYGQMVCSLLSVDTEKYIEKTKQDLNGNGKKLVLVGFNENK